MADPRERALRGRDADPRDARRRDVRPDGPRPWARACARLLTLVLLVTLVALVATALSACGGVEGTYSMSEGEDVMQDFTLTLDGGEFTLVGPNPLGGEDVEFKGSYTVDGDKISLEMAGEESEVGTIDGDKLVFETIVWTKQ